MTRLFIDHSSPLPPYVQIKEQVKLAYTTGRLVQGDILPSVRNLAKQLGVGEAFVRRAYRELCELGILSTQRRKNVMINPSLKTPPEAEAIVEQAMAECDRVIAWAEKHRLSTVAVARLLMRRATARESAVPSYVYVDAGALLADRFAKMISRAWELSVSGMTIQEIGRLEAREVERFTAILANSYRFEEVIQLLHGRHQRVYPVRIKQASALIRRIRRLPLGSRVLLVQTDEDFRRLGEAVAVNFKELVGKELRFESKPVSVTPDLSTLAGSGKYRIIVVSVHAWDQLSENARRHPAVVQSQSEPDMQSLEEIRISAGVLV